MKRVLSIFLIFLVASFFNLYACSNDNSDKDNPNTSDISTEEERNPTVIKLTKDNYRSYLNISINQTTQSHTLISNTYHVVYRNGHYDDNYTSLNPPTYNVQTCKLIYSTYSVLTTFTVKCHSKNKDYIFSNSNFSISYRTSSSPPFFVTVYISQDGNGSEVFMMSENLTNPNIIYSLQVSDLISSFKGEVSFFNDN